MDLAAMQVALDQKTGVSLTVDAQRGFINEAIQTISADKDWPWLDGIDTTNTATIANQSDYELPSDWERSRAVTIDGRTCKYINVADADQIANFGDQTSLWMWTIDDNDLIIAPTPGSAYTLVHRYVKQEPMLVNPTDTPLTPSRFHYGIITYAAMLVFQRKDNAKMAAVFHKSWGDWRDKMIDECNRTTGPKRIRVRNGSIL